MPRAASARAPDVVDVVGVAAVDDHVVASSSGSSLAIMSST